MDFTQITLGIIFNDVLISMSVVVGAIATSLAFIKAQKIVLTFLYPPDKELIKYYEDKR